MADWTPDQIMRGIAAALRECDFKAAVSLLHMLAVKDPESARKIHDAVMAAAGAGER
jgi:hypothetical protein